MPTFEFSANKADGSQEKGLHFASDVSAAVSQLTAKGLIITSIHVASSFQDPLSAAGGHIPPPASSKTRSTEAPHEPVIESMSYSEPNPFPEGSNPYSQESTQEGPPVGPRSYAQTNIIGRLMPPVPITDLAFFFRQLSVMLQAGVPYVQSMDTLSNQTRTPAFRKILTELKQHVEMGRPISAGLQRYPEVFTPIMVSLTRAGEEGGFLDKAFSQIADYTDQEIELKNLYKRLTLYPKLQIAASIIIIIAANAIISSVGVPGSNKLSSPLTEPITWVFLGPILIGIFLFLRVGLANGTLRYRWDAMLAHLPGVSTTVRQLTMARFGRAFAALYKGGVPITRTVHLAADACGNEYYREKIYPAQHILESGQGITETFASTQAFSPIVMDMVSTGEKTGNLDLMLNKVGEYYEDEAKTGATKTATITGVILSLLVAIYIAYIVISFYTGYFGSLTDQVNGT